MIFVTIGTQEPFDRLIKAMDEIAPQLSGVPIFVQTLNSGYRVKNMNVINFLSPDEFSVYFNNAKLVISHAGMGTIISALEQEKPIIVMPRLLKLKEHRNEHQLATSKKLDKLGYIRVAYDEGELKKMVLKVLFEDLRPLYKIGNSASDSLLTSLRDFINLKAK